MQKYEILGAIGEGAYGVVLRCRVVDTGEVVAIKKFKQDNDDQLGEKIAAREVRILKGLCHPNIVPLKEAFRKKGRPYLVFQYLEKNLLEVIEQSPKGLPVETVRLLAYQLLRGVAHLHTVGLLHRDIKPQNILVGQQNQLKICDFGFARQARMNSGTPLTDYVATRWYRPPELLVGGEYGCPIDVWAVGTIMAELIDGKPLFPGEDEVDQLFIIQKCLGPLPLKQQQALQTNPRFQGSKFAQIHTLYTLEKRYMGKLSSSGLNLLKSLLKMDPSQRITAAQALNHPYFDGAKEDCSIRKQYPNNNYIKKDTRSDTTRENQEEHRGKSTHKYAQGHNQQAIAVQLKKTKIAILEKLTSKRHPSFKITSKTKHSKSVSKNNSKEKPAHSLKQKESSVQRFNKIGTILKSNYSIHADQPDIMNKRENCSQVHQSTTPSKSKLHIATGANPYNPYEILGDPEGPLVMMVSQNGRKIRKANPVFLISNGPSRNR